MLKAEARDVFIQKVLNGNNAHTARYAPVSGLFLCVLESFNQFDLRLRFSCLDFIVVLLI